MAEESIITRTPPYDDKAERSVIASMIIDRNAASEICGMLLKEDFYNKQYGIVFDALKELTQQGKPVDELVLVEKLKQMGAPEELCNPGYILDAHPRWPSCYKWHRVRRQLTTRCQWLYPSDSGHPA